MHVNRGRDKKREPYSVDEAVELGTVTPRCRKDCCDSFDTKVVSGSMTQRNTWK